MRDHRPSDCDKTPGKTGRKIDVVGDSAQAEPAPVSRRVLTVITTWILVGIIVPSDPLDPSQGPDRGPGQPHFVRHRQAIFLVLAFRLRQRKSAELTANRMLAR